MRYAVPMPVTNNFRGVVTMLCAVSLLSLMDAGLKQLSGHYPALQLCALRSLASWPFALVWVASTTGLPSLLRVRWPLHLLRGAIGIATLSAFVFGVRYLPLSSAYALFFIAPLLITAMGAFVLRERVDRKRWLVIAVGFVGVLIALRPTGQGLFTWAGLAVIGAAFGYSISAITVRVLGRTDSTQSMVFWVLTLMGVGAGLLAVPNWVPIERGDWLLIAAVGIVGGLGQFAITDAFRRAEASVIAPIEYTALAWSINFDAWVWGVLPDAMTWVGAAVIVASGLYLIRHERSGLQPAAAAQVQP
jgi:drug/metabolite transporter (DMT)-like permease